MKKQRWASSLLLSSVLGCAPVIAVMSAEAPVGEPTSATLPPEVLKQIGQVETEIDQIEAATLERLAASG